MSVAALVGGGFNMASNFVAQRMPDGQYNIFETALSALGILAIPALGMQASFAAQAAGADTDAQRQELRGVMRGALGLMGIVWLMLGGWWLLRQEQIMENYSLTQPLMLWLVLCICLVSMVTPIPSGVLQGRQDFLWFGWATLLNGVGRFIVLLLVVNVFKFGALGGLGGVLAGGVLVLGIVTWRTWDGFRGLSLPFLWLPWLKRVVPVTIGLGALTFILQADALIMRAYLQPELTPDEMDGYFAVRKIAQALVFVVGALTSVMFPKVARSFQRSEKSDALKLTVILTLGVGVAGATVATFAPLLPLRLLSPERLWGSQVLVPTYCWALVPVALASVLVWSLLARECYRAVPWLAVVALGYWTALMWFHQDRMTVIWVLGGFACLLVLVCSIFLWIESRRGAGAVDRAGQVLG
jgi:O-antigen/teichoic acid export membrane protein